MSEEKTWGAAVPAVCVLFASQVLGSVLIVTVLQQVPVDYLDVLLGLAGCLAVGLISTVFIVLSLVNCLGVMDVQRRFEEDKLVAEDMESMRAEEANSAVLAATEPVTEPTPKPPVKKPAEVRRPRSW